MMSLWTRAFWVSTVSLTPLRRTLWLPVMIPASESFSRAVLTSVVSSFG